MLLQVSLTLAEVWSLGKFPQCHEIERLCWCLGGRPAFRQGHGAADLMGASEAAIVCYIFMSYCIVLHSVLLLLYLYIILYCTSFCSILSYCITLHYIVVHSIELY